MNGWRSAADFTRFKLVAHRVTNRQRTPSMLSPLNVDNNIPTSTPPSTPPGKRRKLDVPATERLPSFEEEPHLSPSKIGELGLHVLLSPKNDDKQKDQVFAVARTLTFTVTGSQHEVEKEDEESMEHWDRPRESMYVSAFNTAVDTVIEREGHLFSEEEINIINAYQDLPCFPLRLRADYRREHVLVRPSLPSEKVAMVPCRQVRLLFWYRRYFSCLETIDTPSNCPCRGSRCSHWPRRSFITIILRWTQRIRQRNKVLRHNKIPNLKFPVSYDKNPNWTQQMFKWQSDTELWP